MTSVAQTTTLFEVPIFTGTKATALSILQDHIAKKDGLLRVCTPNPEQFVLSWKDQSFLSVLQTSDLNLPDGAGVVWAVKKIKATGVREIHRIPGREVFHDLLVLAKENEWGVFFLGGKPGSAQALMAKWGVPNWAHDSGALDIRNETQAERGRVLEKIRDVQPQLLFVAYGAPWQEKWIADNAQELERAGVKVAMVVGGSFEYEAGLVPRVHPAIATLNLEWLQRLIIEPWRWKRQLIGLQFFVKVLFS